MTAQRGSPGRSQHSPFRSMALLWACPAWSMILALAAYLALALLRGPLWPAGRYAYYNYLADAFLHGQLHLRVLPPSLHDLSFFQGQYYLYWGPLPAVPLLPLVALFGITFSDILFTSGVAALNVGLTALVLREANRRGLLEIGPVQRGLLVLFFALGTVHTTMGPVGQVWFTGQAVAYLCIVLAYLAAIALEGRWAFVLCGISLSAAMLTRTHLPLVGLWPAVYLLYRRYKEGGWRLSLLVDILLVMLPLLLGVGLLGLYNWARFGNVFDNGLAHHAMHEIFVEEYQQYGAFHPYYLKRNLFYHYLAYPLLPGADRLQGGSLFLLSPVFMGAFWGLFRGRPRWSAWTLLLTIMLVNIPILLLMGTGFIQFGPRYTLDFTMPLLLLTAMGVRRWPTWLLAGCTLISIAHYVAGTLWILP